METKYTWKESLPVAESSTLASVQKYGKTLFKETFVEAMVYGDFEKSDAETVVSLFQNKTNTIGVAREDVFDVKYLAMKNPESIQYVNQLRVNNSCFYREYVIGNETPELRAITKVIGTALQQPFFTEMRTNQQLGYIVGSYPNNKDNTFYLSFLIQSGVYSADEVNKRAEKFIATTPDIFKEMDENTFEQLIKSEIEKLEKSPMSIAERAGKLKTLIFEHDADYMRDEKTISVLKTLDKEKVTEVLTMAISPQTRKMINVLSFAENHENVTGLQTSFNDLSTWKSSRSYE
tara:strand:- start:3635 stop:4507 length:873 start_codon:yes stop_codon:yes gene_type:complete